MKPYTLIQKGERTMIREAIEQIRQWLTADEDEEYEPSSGSSETSEDYQKDYQEGKKPGNIASFIMIEKPKRFEEIQKISDHIKHARAVLLNIQDLPPQDKQRTIDFLSGVALARNGSIAKIYQNVYLCTPENIGVIEE